MINKSRKKTPGSTLHVFDLEPITDPTELEAIDLRRKAAEKAMVAAARKKLPRKKMRGPTLQEIEIVSVTDPAELEAVDRRCKAAEKAMAAAQIAGKRKSPKRK